MSVNSERALPQRGESIKRGLCREMPIAKTSLEKTTSSVPTRAGDDDRSMLGMTEKKGANTGEAERGPRADKHRAGGNRDVADRNFAFEIRGAVGRWS